MDYSQAFLTAVDHLMLYEVGGWWNVNAPGAQDGTVPRACGYTNDPNDAGGETKYGISKRNNPTVDVTNLDWPGAQAVYYANYWLTGHCDQLPGCVAALQFDGNVNNGVGTSAKFLQRAAGVTADGAIGPGTLAAVAAMDPIALCNSVCDQRTAYYNQVVITYPQDQQYLAGWLRRVSEMRAFVTDPNGNF
jgi:lysozyme family protein